MQIYNSILLVTLLFTGIAVHSPHFGVHSKTLNQSDSEYLSLAQQSSDKSECPNSGQSSLPGCGRRDKVRS